MGEPAENVVDGGKDIADDSSSWKSKLSASFNDQQIFFSLSVLVVFYVGYTIGRANFDVDDNNRNEEERFIQSCYCSFSQRFFLRFWFSFYCLLWFMIHSYTFFAQILIKKCPKLDECFKNALACCIVCPSFSCDYINHCVCKKPEKPINPKPVKKEVEFEDFRRLWFQYCELYVVGYTKDDDSAQDKKEKKNQLCDQQNSSSTNSTNGQEHGCVCCTKHISRHCSSSTKFIIRAMLLFIKYISQLVTVPLLFLQIFDTYSLLCFSPDPYCSRTTEYKLHLAQAAVTLLFYCSLASSQLASTILTWNPWPNK